MSTAIDPIVRPSRIQAYTGLSRATIYRQMAKEAFPQTTELSDRSVGWPLSVINTWRTGRGLPPTGYLS